MDFITQLFQNMNLMGGGIALLVGIPFILVGLVFLFMVVRTGGKVRASRRWLSTRGRVLAAYVEMRRGTTGRGGRTTSYYPVVLYEYAVNGQRLRSNRIRFGGDIGFGWTGVAQQTVDRYPEGAMIEVFYNPEAPEEAVLERSASTANRIFTCVALFIIGMVVVSLAMTFGGFALVQQLIQGLGIGQLLDSAPRK